MTEIRERLGSWIYGEGTTSLAQVMGNCLREAGLTLATAESCTGGMVGQLVTQVAGASDYYLGGAVCYAVTGLIGRRMPPQGVLETAAAASMAGGILGLVFAGIVNPAGLAGASVGLPFLEAMLPRSAWAADTAPWLAAHMDVNAIDLTGVEDPALARSLEESAAENLKRVVRPARGTDWSLQPGIERMTAFLETKTVWHPIGI